MLTSTPASGHPLLLQYFVQASIVIPVLLVNDAFRKALKLVPSVKQPWKVNEPTLAGLLGRLAVELKTESLLVPPQVSLLFALQTMLQLVFDDSRAPPF